MKKHLLYIGLMMAGLLVAGCASANKANTYQAIIQANMDCQTDADCVAVNRTCCRCDGKIAVNRRVAGKLRAKWVAECTSAPCLQAMCFTDMSVSCQNKRCVGKLMAY